MGSETKCTRPYEEAWAHYTKRFDPNKYMKFTECFSELTAGTSVSEAKSMISVGVADATLDKLLLEFALPNLNHVIAIEPDSEFNKQIDEAFTGFQNRQIKVDIDNGTLEDYPGPSSKVDLILLANVLSFFPKTADREIQRCLQWLNPGGHVVIILNTMNPILEATDGLRKNGYTAALDGKGVLKKLNLTYKENNAKILFDLSEENIKYPLRLWTDQMPTPEQVKLFLQRLDLENVYINGSKTSYMTYGFYLVPDQKISSPSLA